MNIEEMHSWFDVLQDKGDSPYFTVEEKTQFLNRAQSKFVNEMMFKHYFVTGAQPEKEDIPYSSLASIQAGEDVLRPLITECQSWDNHRRIRYPDGDPNQSTELQNTPTVNKWGNFSLNQLNYYVRGGVWSRNNSYHNASTWDQVRVLNILSIAWSAWSHISFRYVRRVDVEKILDNSFKAPTVSAPIFYSVRGGIFEVLPRRRPDGISFYKAYDYGSGTGGNNYTNYTKDISGVRQEYPAITTAGTYDGPPWDHQPTGALHGGIYDQRMNVTVIRSPLPMRYEPTTFEVFPTSANVNVSCELPEFTHDDIMAIALDDAGVASRDEALQKLNAVSKSVDTPGTTVNKTYNLK